MKERRSEKRGMEAGRRRLLIGGVAGLGLLGAGVAGWLGWRGEDGERPAEGLTRVAMEATRENAIRAAGDIVGHYARQLRNASAGIHAVRAFGRGFSFDDGTRMVDFLCRSFAAEREAGGKRYVIFPREHEVHDNSFLKTMLEAGVSAEQPISAGGNRYTLRDLGESAKALFRFDAGNLRRYDPLFPEEHLPWGLIAFSMIVRPDAAQWVNAWGEKIDLNEVIDLGLADFESVCRLLVAPDAPARGESVEYRRKITQYSCYGMHSFYGFFSCYRHGYRENRLEERLAEVTDHLVTRLQRDAEALEQETVAARAEGQRYIEQMKASARGRRGGAAAPPDDLIEIMSLGNFIRMSGHAFEALNYVRLHRLFPFSMVQERRMQAAEADLFRALVGLRARDLDRCLRWDPKFVSDQVIAIAHALRAMKLNGPENPDNAA